MARMARTRVRWGRVGALLAGAGVAMTVAASAAQGSVGDGAVVHDRRPAVRTYLVPVIVLTAKTLTLEERRSLVHQRLTALVRPGDTLWGIARRLAGPEADPRPVVDALVRANHVMGSLPVGARLVLPS